MFTLIKHPNYLCYLSQKKSMNDILFVNFDDIIFDSNNSLNYLLGSFEEIGISKEVFLDTEKMARSIRGNYSLNLHIDLLNNYLLSRGVFFEDSASKIVKIFLAVYQNSNNFIRDDVRKFVSRYSEVLDIIFYGFSTNQHEIDKRFSNELNEMVFAHVFFNEYSALHLVEMLNNIVCETGYNSVLFMDTSEENQRVVQSRKIFDNLTHVEIPVSNLESNLSEKVLDTFDYIVI